MSNLSHRPDKLTVETKQIADPNDNFEREPFFANVTSKESGNWPEYKTLKYIHVYIYIGIFKKYRYFYIYRNNP